MTISERIKFPLFIAILVTAVPLTSSTVIRLHLLKYLIRTGVSKEINFKGRVTAVVYLKFCSFAWNNINVQWISVPALWPAFSGSIHVKTHRTARDAYTNVVDGTVSAKSTYFQCTYFYNGTGISGSSVELCLFRVVILEPLWSFHSNLCYVRYQRWRILTVKLDTTSCQ